MNEMTDAATRLFSTNLLAPLKLDDPIAQLFVRNNACAIWLGHLVMKHAEGRTSTIECPECGPIYLHNYTSKVIANVSISNNLAARRELQPDKPSRPEDEILSDLGF